MNRFSKNIDVYIILLLLNFFCMCSFMYFNLDKNVIVNFIMLGLMFIVSIISYFRGIVEGFYLVQLLYFFMLLM